MRKPKKTKQFLTVRDASRRLMLSEKSIFRFIQSGELIATKFGRWRITAKDLQDLIKRRSNVHKHR